MNYSISEIVTDSHDFRQLAHEFLAGERDQLPGFYRWGVNHVLAKDILDAAQLEMASDTPVYERSRIAFLIEWVGDDAPNVDAWDEEDDEVRVDGSSEISDVA